VREVKRLALLLLVLLAACTGAPPQPAPAPQPDVSGPATTLRVLAGSELADLQPILTEAARATGVTVKMTFTGSLEGAQTVADGKADGNFDALWFSSTRYLETIPEARQRLGTSTRIMGSPVVLGLRKSVADKLGWGAQQVGWSEIAAAAGRGEFTFAMSDPAASNTPPWSRSPRRSTAAAARSTPPRSTGWRHSWPGSSPPSASPQAPPAGSPTGSPAGPSWTGWSTTRRRSWR
jgi:Ca-activated chloride channel family protein